MKKMTVLMMSFLVVAATAFAATPAEKQDIVDTAIAAGNFNTLVQAVQAAGSFTERVPPCFWKVGSMRWWHWLQFSTGVIILRLAALSPLLAT